MCASWVEILKEQWPYRPYGNEGPNMDVSRLGDFNSGSFSLGGPCPHCDRPTVFLLVTSVHLDQLFNAGGVAYRHHLQGVLQCQGCKKYILGIVSRGVQNDPNMLYEHVAHYPLGKANDTVASEIPEHIAADFREALRCRFVDAYNATVEMCRRAVQAGCIEQGAPADKKLVTQIDWLATKGTITTPLKDMAHRVRLGGNLGAHPPEDPDDPSEIIIGNVYADAVIEFTREFFQHVYVMPERLKKFTFKK